jgi:hypothetical protein
MKGQNMAAKKSGLTIIKPGDSGYVEGLAQKGKPDVVSPELAPVVSKMKLGESFQLVEGEPFTISQLRYWQPKGSTLLPEGQRLQIAGGNGTNIEISVVEDDGKPRGRAAAGTGEAKPVAKAAPAKKAAPRKVKSTAGAVKKPAKKPAKRPAVKKAAAKASA